jgi:hypothetical protein
MEENNEKKYLYPFIREVSSTNSPFSNKFYNIMYNLNASCIICKPNEFFIDTSNRVIIREGDYGFAYVESMDNYDMYNFLKDREDLDELLLIPKVLAADTTELFEYYDIYNYDETTYYVRNFGFSRNGKDECILNISGRYFIEDIPETQSFSKSICTPSFSFAQFITNYFLHYAAPITGVNLSEKIKEIDENIILEEKSRELDIDKINTLAEECLKVWKTEDRIDIAVCEGANTVELMVHYPNLTIENDEGGEVYVEDLYVSILFNNSITSAETFRGARTKFFPEDVANWYRECCDGTGCEGCADPDDEDAYESITEVQLYSHSHLSGNSWGGFQHFCLGDTHLSLFLQKAIKPSTDFPFKYLLRVLDGYLHHESIEGGPWILMEDRGIMSGNNNQIWESTNNNIISVSLRKISESDFEIPINIQQGNKLSVNLEEFTHKFNTYLSTKKEDEIPLNFQSYGKVAANGNIITRLKRGVSRYWVEDISYYIEDNAENIKFKGERIRVTLDSGEDSSQNNVIEKYGIFPTTANSIVRELNKILNNDKEYERFANNELQG